MAYDVIEIQPTLFTGAQQDQDLLADWTEIKLPARSVRIVNIQGAIDDSDADNDIYALVFAQQNTNSLGTLGVVGTSLSFTELLENKILGKLDFEFNSSGFNSIAAGSGSTNVKFGTLNQPAADQENEFVGMTAPLILKSGLTDNVVYLGIFAEGTGGGTFAADAMRLFLHIEY